MECLAKSALRSVAAGFPKRAKRIPQVQLSYIGLVGSYLTVAGQLNLAVGREVMQ
jgi:hypothetical protein